jgi:hypothetical protein
MQGAKWRYPALEADCEAREKLLAVIGENEAAWEALEKRVDFPADRRREELRAKLPALYSKRNVIERRILQGSEFERIVNETLLPQHAQKFATVQRLYKEFVTSPDFPSDAEFQVLAAASHELHVLTTVLYEATGLPEFRRPLDAVRELRSRWFEVNRGRERLFHLIGPGNKPKLGEAAWLPAAHRLTELRASTTTSQEMVNAR